MQRPLKQATTATRRDLQPHRLTTWCESQHLNPCNPATGPRKTFFHNPITRTYCRYLVHDICIYVYCICMYQGSCLNSNFLRCQGLESSQGLGPPSPTGLPSLGHFAPLLNEPNLVIGALPSRTVDFFLGFIGDGDGEGLGESSFAGSLPTFLDTSLNKTPVFQTLLPFWRSRLEHV